MDSIALTGVVRNLNRGVTSAATASTRRPHWWRASAILWPICRVGPAVPAEGAAGAEFAITQPVFDPDCLFRFLDAIQEFDPHRGRHLALHEFQERGVHGQ
jgi:5,10-methylenetetrahydrofolate reductase